MGTWKQYQRGSAAISAQFAREAYARGASSYNPDAIRTVTPRPADWGGKVYGQALDRARSMIRFMVDAQRRFGRGAPDREVVLIAVLDRVRVSRETAERAVAAAWAEYEAGQLGEALPALSAPAFSAFGGKSTMFGRRLRFSLAGIGDCAACGLSGTRYVDPLRNWHRPWTPGHGNRVTFNWGYHDGAAEYGRNRVRSMAHHPDPVYAQGYIRGVYDAQDGTDTSDSTAAWEKALRDGYVTEGEPPYRKGESTSERAFRQLWPASLAGFGGLSGARGGVIDWRTALPAEKKWGVDFVGSTATGDRFEIVAETVRGASWHEVYLIPAPDSWAGGVREKVGSRATLSGAKQLAEQTYASMTRGGTAGLAGLGSLPQGWRDDYGTGLSFSRRGSFGTLIVTQRIFARSGRWYVARDTPYVATYAGQTDFLGHGLVWVRYVQQAVEFPTAAAAIAAADAAQGTV